MRISWDYGLAAVFFMVVAGILVAGTAIVPENGLFAATVAAALTYGVWLNSAALVPRLFPRMPRPRGMRLAAQPLALAAACGMFVLGMWGTLPSFTGFEWAMTGGMLIAAGFAMWLWHWMLGGEAPAGVLLLNPVPSLLVSFVVFTDGFPVAALAGLLFLAWGFLLVTRPEKTEGDVARVLHFHKAKRFKHARKAA